MRNYKELRKKREDLKESGISPKRANIVKGMKVARSFRSKFKRRRVKKILNQERGGNKFPKLDSKGGSSLGSMINLKCKLRQN